MNAGPLTKADAKNRHANREPPRLQRRDLLQGKFWKLIRARRPSPSPAVRYPKPVADEASPTRQPYKSIAGIIIEPVKPTEFSSPVTSERAMPVFRPPGAIEETRFVAGCTRCNECAAACPYDAIRPAPERLGQIGGTQFIEADRQACLMCADFPCISACEPRVLSHSIDKVLGTAVVTEHLCSAYHETPCSVCHEQCPVDGAIETNDGKPKDVESVCNGCGVCRQVCPAPENEILLMTMLQRPLPASDDTGR